MTIEQQIINAGRQADSEHPERLRINRNVDCFAHTSRVLEILGKPWAYVGKTAGEGQYTPPGMTAFTATGRDGKVYVITGVSHDAITNGPLVYDLLGAGNDGPEPLGSPAHVQALSVPPEHHRPNNPPVPYPLKGASPAPPAPSPVGYPDEPTFWRTFQERMKKAYIDAGRTFPDPNDPDAYRRFSRCGYDIGRGADAQQSADKHLSELRKELGV